MHAPSDLDPAAAAAAATAVAAGSVGGPSEQSLRAWQDGGSLIEQALLEDEQEPELWDLIESTAAGGYSHDNPTFVKKKTIVLPEALLEQYRDLECKCFMGLFTEIHRAWITIDNQLFLWNYEDGSDFYVYDGLDQIVISAALVRPRAGVFVEGIEYLCVLATPVEVVLLGVGFSGGGIDGELTLYPTQMSIPSDNVNMLKIVGTPNGRIFMAGKDGSLHELLYSADDSWFRSKCRKHNHTQYMLASLVPSFLQFTAPDALVDVVVDESRNLLYTLSERSHIAVYDLGESGDSLTHVATASSIAKDANQIYRRGNFTASTFGIVALGVVPRSESTAVHLVAITTTGVRLFFSTLAYEHRFNASPANRATVLELVHVRRPPASHLRMSSTTMARPSLSAGTLHHVHTAFYCKGVVLMADEVDAESDVVLGISADVRGRAGREEVGMSEFSSVVGVEGKTWAIGEVPPALTPALSTVDDEVVGRDGQNALYTQHVRPPRQFVCLSNSGLHIVELMRPVDVLQLLLEERKGIDSEELQMFFQMYGEGESCAMCLLLITQGTSMNASLRSHRTTASNAMMRNSHVVELAKTAFFKLGGVPRIISSARGGGAGAGAGGSLFGGAAGTGGGVSRVQFSGTHSGLCKYVARLLQPVWDVEVTLSKEGGQLQRCRLAPEQIEGLQAPLAALMVFLESTPEFIAPPRQDRSAWGGDSDGVDASASATSASHHHHHHHSHHTHNDTDPVRVQQRSLSHLHLFIRRAVEAFSFLQVIAENHVPKLVALLPGEVQRNLSRLTFRELVTGPEGAAIASHLITALISQYASDSVSVEAITNTLRQRCPSFFSEADLTQYRAYELQQSARNAVSEQERDNLLHQSLALYRRVAEHVDVMVVCHEYQRMRFYAGAIELALARAQAVDPMSLALQVQDGTVSADDARARAVHEQRMECYSCVLDVFTELFNRTTSTEGGGGGGAPASNSRAYVQQYLARAVRTQDALFHTILYRWLIENELTQELLELTSPYLEAFLKKEDIDLLWQYYARNRKHALAAHILAKLGEHRGNEYSLEERLRYLSLAVQHAKCVTGRATRSSGELVHELEEKLEVARIQGQVVSELEGLVAAGGVGDAPLPFEEETRARAAVDELNTGLFDISALYNRFAVKFHLWDCCLAIVHSSGHDDPALVHKLWTDIIDRALQGESHTAGQLEAVAHKVRTLALAYAASPQFPLAHVSSLLLSLGFKAGEVTWAWGVLRGVVAHSALYDTARSLLSNKQEFWRGPDAQLFLLHSTVLLVAAWVDELARHRAPSERAAFVERAVHEDLDKYVAVLGGLAVAGAAEVLQACRDLQARVQKLLTSLL